MYDCTAMDTQMAVFAAFYSGVCFCYHCSHLFLSRKRKTLLPQRKLYINETIKSFNDLSQIMCNVGENG